LKGKAWLFQSLCISMDKQTTTTQRGVMLAVTVARQKIIMAKPSVSFSM